MAEELGGSPKLKFSLKETSATRVFKEDWDQVFTFVASFFPNGKPVTYPGYTYLPVDTVDVEPFMDDDEIFDTTPASHKNGAKVTVSYKTLEYKTEKEQSGKEDKSQPGNQKAKEYVEVSTSVSGEFITYPCASMQWHMYDEELGLNTEDVGEEMIAHRLVAIVEFTIKMHQVRQPPWEEIMACVGRVNQEKYYGNPVGTMLFLGVTASQKVGFLGNKPWELEYKFAYKNNGGLEPEIPLEGGAFSPEAAKGWNYYLVGSSTTDAKFIGTFQRLAIKDGENPNKPIYDYASFTLLLVDTGTNIIVDEE